MRRILVTGANRGIGLALAKEAAAHGARVFATCRRPGDALALRELAAENDRVSVHRLDVLDGSTLTAVADEIGRGAGALDGLINNAGINRREDCHRHVDQFDSEEFLDLLRTNTAGPMAVTRALLPLLRQGERPVVAFISSDMASIGNKADVDYTYSASKAALNMLAKVLALELRDEGVRVVTLSPGWVATDMGGPSAPLRPEPVARGLLAVIDGLGMDASGSFLNWEGSSVPW